MKERVNKTKKIIIYTFIIILAIALTIFILINVSKTLLGRMIILLLLMVMTLACLVTMIMLIIQNLMELPKQKMEKYIVKKILRTGEEYTELIFSPYGDEKWNEYYLITTVRDLSRCKFYAKLTKDESIHLIVLDEEKSKIYNIETTNYYRFNLRFKPKV